MSSGKGIGRNFMSLVVRSLFISKALVPTFVTLGSSPEIEKRACSFLGSVESRAAEKSVKISVDYKIEKQSLSNHLFLKMI